MDFTEVIEGKKSKIESSLRELFSEISTATNYLHQLKGSSAAVVTNLNTINQPSRFLSEFMNVNYFLLKSITFLTEINCKFEMLDISDKWVNNMISNTEAYLSEIADKSGQHLNYESSKEVSSKESNSEVLENAIADVGHTVNLIKKKRAKKKKSKKSQAQQCEIKDNSSNCARISTVSCENNSNHNSSSCNTLVCNESTAGGQQKSKSVEQTRPTVSAAAKNNSEVVLSPKEHATKKTDCQNLSKTTISIGNSCQEQQEKTKHNSLGDISNFLDLINTFNKHPPKVSGNAAHTSGEIPVAEVVPTKIWDWWSNSNTENFHCCRATGGDDLIADKEKIKNEGKEDDIKPVNIDRKIGKEYDVVIEHIISPSEFYVSLVGRQADLLKEMEEKLKLIPVNKYDANGTKDKYSKAMLSSEIGKYALVYLKCDEMWCRAKITNWCLNYNDNFVNVFLLDYGESKCVSTDDLRAMPEFFKEYPAFIVRCHLHDVFPVDVDISKPTIGWGREASEKMKSLTENSKQIRIKLAPHDHIDPSVSLSVTLWLVDQDNQCVNKILVKTKYAIHEPKGKKSEIKTDKLETDNTENDFLNNWNPMKEDFESYQNSYDFDINDPSTIIYGYVGKDYERICKHFANKGRCFKGGACKKEHKKLDHLGFTTDQEEVYQSAFYNLPVPPPKAILNVQVTCLLNYNNFFCFLETQTSPNEEDLQSLLKHMNKKENVLNMRKLLIPPSPGQIVIALYSGDEAWYRARILESQPENDKYVVIFVDYGNKEIMPLSHIRAIEARYLHLPFQAVQCSIFGIQQNPKVPMKEVMDYMKKRLDDGYISIEVIARLPGEHINLLVKVFDRKGENIGEDLIAKNYALSKKEMVINSNSESLPG